MVYGTQHLAMYDKRKQEIYGAVIDTRARVDVWGIL